MEANEARKISDRAMASQRISNYVAEIQRRAKDGYYEASFGSLDAKVIDAFKMLGYRVEKSGGNVSVRWGAV